MKLYKTENGILLERDDLFYRLHETDWDQTVNRDDLYGWLEIQVESLIPLTFTDDIPMPEILAPIGSQEVWASGVTYFRSRTARMEESEKAGGGSFYDRVYEAERPELFFKSTAWRVVGNHGTVRIRRDSTWDVPEPELTLFASSSGTLVGYTIGNDMSSRSIEGENPLYLPQAKSYTGSAALGPCLYVPEFALGDDTVIDLAIVRAGEEVFSGEVTLAQMKRKPDELLQYLFREMAFPHGAYLMTGTGIIPPSDFTLQQGDIVHISIEPIGTLTNVVG
ncbi:fumarylacetoacetate hydrolase family protein [Dyadobacter fanqingshengii]|uniref:Fumarylacetoacetate hydrolase family protein n=1 Tax=Dyadobacter fanqingshengii TaxID=2906443 RepID=A0A9X1PFD8_9BACT|nr:fumarylacetoacetate hydrolase family protein [Dyadobacter fanqingshengii]MCF0043532.1 fumarylacetoacetate hydrolase family protein [Dyadobacter fanqingshengii]MCF2504121.1 fumarylacetoacetate hydrolase family protein [Dyadobacter fanqingshengii]USJ34849.1 fumarylacetoacetate hydrolase family protein [Dyadobacter fanqingshengii]